MKTPLFQVLSILFMVFFMLSCQEEVADIGIQEDQLKSQLQEDLSGDPGLDITDFLAEAKGGVPGPPDNGDDDDPDDGSNEQVIYGIFYDGSIINGEETFAVKESDNGKYANMDGMYCGSTSLSGLNQLSACFSSSYCARFHEIRQFNKKKLPDRVAIHFWFDVPGSQFSYILSMYGTLSQPTIFPATSGPADNINVVFDKFEIREGDDASCRVENTTFDAFFGVNDGSRNQLMTIRKLSDADVASLSCDDVGSNCL